MPDEIDFVARLQDPAHFLRHPEPVEGNHVDHTHVAQGVHALRVRALLLPEGCLSLLEDLVRRRTRTDQVEIVAKGVEDTRLTGLGGTSGSLASPRYVADQDLPPLEVRGSAAIQRFGEEGVWFGQVGGFVLEEFRTLCDGLRPDEVNLVEEL